MFDNQTWFELLLMGFSMLTLFFLVFFLMNIISRWVGLSREDRITVLFCGSKKSLVQGAVMGKVLFVDPAMMGAALVPVMIYHSLQLLTGSAMPSTVSSSVVMVSIAQGNIPAAIFNASISSIAGIFITPIWMSLWIEPAGVGGGLGEVFIKLILLVS